MFNLKNIFIKLINTTNNSTPLKHISTSNRRRGFSFDSFKKFANEKRKFAIQIDGKVICLQSSSLEISPPDGFEFKFDPESMNYIFQQKPIPKKFPFFNLVSK